MEIFFQATEYPCEEIVRSNGIRRLHARVTPSTLSSANVERRGLGLTKVNHNNFIDTKLECVSCLLKASPFVPNLHQFL